MKKFNLKLDEYLSDYAKHIPNAPGQYLIKAQTGVGKTHHQIKMAQTRGVYTIFPVKSIVAQQREEAKAQNLKSDNIIQLEHFLNVSDDDINAVILDECQWLYEGGFRQSIEDLHKKLTRLSKTVPIYYFSGTYDADFCPVGFDDNVIEFNKPFERALHTYELNVIGPGLMDRHKDAILKVLRQETTIAKERGTCVLFFLDSEETLTELAERLKKDGFKADVFTSKLSEKNRPDSIKHLFTTSTIANCGADIILSTSGLEAGININDDVTIVSVPAHEGKLVQRFGRARNGGRFVLIHGVGEEEKRLKPNKKVLSSAESFDESEIYEVNFNDQYYDKCKFNDAAHRSACDRYDRYAKISRQFNFSVDILHTLLRLGYNALIGEPYTFEVSTNREIWRKVSKKKIRSAIGEICGENPTVSDIKRNRAAIANLLVADDITLPVVNVRVNRAIEAINQINLLQIIKENAADVFEAISADSVNMLINIEHKPEFEKKAREMRDSLDGKKITVDKINAVANAYWEYVCSDKLPETSAWMADDMQSNRTKLFKYLVGIESGEVDNHTSYVKKEKSWWKDNFETSADKVKYTKMKKAASGAGFTMDQIHEDSGFTRSQLVSKFTPSEIKKKLSSDNVIWF